jgi:hypothetical protein
VVERFLADLEAQGTAAGNGAGNGAR